MKRRVFLRPTMAFCGGLLAARAAEPASPSAPDRVIELPPMIVSESRDTNKWLYASVGGDEYLSALSPAGTRSFIEADERALHQLHAIVPEEFLASPASVTILMDRAQEPKAGDPVGQQVLGTDEKSRAAVRYLPNLRIDGRDVSATFAYIDEAELAQTEMSISANFLRFQLERRTPMLPPWLVEGILAVHRQVARHGTPVTLHPFIWISAAESSALARDPSRPRALLPAGEMFAPDALRGEENHHPRRVETLRAQVGLLVRWALDPRNQVRDKFWTFARRATEQRVTEEMFLDCFGFGFSDLRDRLNDYLALAVKEPLHLETGAQPQIPTPQVRDATPLQLARLRGTWERLEVGYVQKTQPDFVGRYLTQARATLQRPYQRGETEPWLLAEIGLCEIDAGATTGALKFLEPAIAAGVIRPAACYEVARVRFAGLMRGQPANRIFSAAEITPVLEALRQAIQQTPPLPEVYGLLADAWLRSRDPAPRADVEALVRGAKYFALNPVVSYRLALALARFGRRAEAVELLATGAEYVVDDATRARFVQLQTTLAQ